MVLHRADLRAGDGGGHGGGFQAARFAELIEAGEASLSRLEGLPWWREWLLRKCVRRSGDAHALDSGLWALALADRVTLQDVDEAAAAVASATEDAGLWIRAERAGLLGESRFG